MQAVRRNQTNVGAVLSNLLQRFGWSFSVRWWHVVVVTCAVTLLMPAQRSHAGIVVPPLNAPQGVDVSSFNGSVNWSAVANSGIQFAIARSSNGLTPDTLFQQNYQGIADAGLIRGAYQFFNPLNDATQQANLLLSQIGPSRPGDLPPALDVETASGVSSMILISQIKTWVDTVQTATGVDPTIYTGRIFWNSIGDPVIPDTELWIAAYGTGAPNIPNAWDTPLFWQYSGTRFVPGISGVANRDLFFGSSAELNAVAGIPEPQTYALFIVGFGAIGFLHRRRVRRSKDRGKASENAGAKA